MSTLILESLLNLPQTLENGIPISSILDFFAEHYILTALFIGWWLLYNGNSLFGSGRGFKEYRGHKVETVVNI